MDKLKNRLKEIAHKVYVFSRAAAAAVALGLIEVFGSPRGRRLLALGVLLGGIVLMALRPPVQIIPPGEVGVRIALACYSMDFVPLSLGLCSDFSGASHHNSFAACCTE